MLTKPTKVDETICGYRLKERLGSGGYGEVWSADAPGGLIKAVKIVYGYHDEDRAERELKALNRIKQVRHPFLLSLERIEVVDGKLIVVSELADMGLKDRFDLCLAEGETGIPREELLGYLSDAAEALDYISQTHSLQHLDVKPENFLLVSGHIKVADFGLVKEIEEATASMMGGLTPMYAAPELFDGRPCQFSDQYSLAIVYQEMLTGIRPFSGTTTAQLAAQHMQSRPNLSSLPRSDQATIGRALAKDPDQRFSSCSAMLEGLINTQTSPPKSADTQARDGQRPSDTQAQTPSARRSQPTDLMPPKKGTDALTSVRGLASLPQAATEVRDLPKFQWTEDDARVCPTLFLGIGHTASQTLAKLRGRLNDRFGDAAKTPAIRLLCLDTDCRDLAESTRGEKRANLGWDEILEMPLRTPEEYRYGSSKHLSWLSRRWLYNIPRTLQTEGIRPLGRLALADHAPELFERLAATIGAMTSAQSIATTSKTTGLAPTEGQARIFLLASISGGTGSGMVLDAAYAVRKTLIDLGLPDDYVSAILLHTVQRSGSQRDLAIANTCACLSELYYFSGANGYPGDSSCGLPRFQDNRSTFSDTYLLYLGEELENEELDAATDEIAEYLYLNSVSKCAGVFEACRELSAKSSDQSPDDFTMRSFGLSQIGISTGDVAARVIGHLCHKLVQRWIGSEKDMDDGTTKPSPNRKRTDDLESFVDAQTDRLGLNLDRLVEQVLAIVRQTCGGDVESHLAKVIEEVTSASGEEHSSPHVSAVIDRLEEYFGGPDAEEEPDPEASRFQVTCQKRLNVICRRTTNELADALLTLVDQPNARVHAATVALEKLQSSVGQLSDGSAEHQQEMRCTRQQLQFELLDTDPPKRRGMAGLLRRDRNPPTATGEKHRLLNYARMRMEEFVLQHVNGLISEIGVGLSEVETQLRDMRRTLVRMSEEFLDNTTDEQECNVLLDEDDIEEQNRYLTSTVTQALLVQTPQMAKQLDEHFQNNVFAQVGGLHQMVSHASRELKELPVVIRAEARSAVLSSLNQTDLVQIILESGFSAGQLESILRNRLERAHPGILRCGGAKRLMLALPELPSSRELAEIFSDKLHEDPTVIQRPEGSLVLCYEAEQIPLRNVVFALLDNRPERAKYAARLHTRVDVNWPPLPGND